MGRSPILRPGNGDILKCSEIKHVYFMFQDTCSGKGGYLVEINSEDENDYLKQQVLGIYLKTIHILKSQVAFNKNEIRA